MSRLVLAAIAIAVATFVSIVSQAADSSCKHLLSGAPIQQVGEVQLISSGRDADRFQQYVEAAKIIFGENGIAHQLGIATPPHQIIFAPSAKLAALATLGRHAVGHFADGAKLVHEGSKVSGVLEFVTPRCPTCRSFYRDTTSTPDQIQVLFHVAGHNDVAVHSMYARMRENDPIRASLELGDLVNKYSIEYNRDEVMLWYQHLLSFGFMQDLVGGMFESIESLTPPKPNSGDERVIRVRDEESPYADSRPHQYPKRPTQSVLQAFIANLPADTPLWKKQIATQFEEVYRVYGEYVQTKIMNEGWATFSEIMLTAHSPWNKSKDLIDYAHLMAGVAYPSLTNPYWLGVEGWLNLYRRFFKAHPEYDGLKLIERDRKFVEYAHSIMERVNDFEFIREAFDADWVRKYKLHLYRPATESEIDPNLPQDPAHPENNEQKVIVSTDPQRFIDYLADMLGSKASRIPQVALVKENAFGRNVAAYEHVVHDEIPLNRFLTAQTLYVMAVNKKKSVSLKTVRSSAWDLTQEQIQKVTPPPQYEPGDKETQWGMQKDWYAQYKPVQTPIRVEVAPSGKVEVFDLGPEGENGVPVEMPNERLQKQLQYAVDEYRDDMEASLSSDFIEDWRDQFGQRIKLGTEIADNNTAGITNSLITPGVGLHDPRTAHAIDEYHQIVKVRALDALKRAMKNGKLKRTQKGLRVRALPVIPEFELDQSVATFKKAFEPPAPVEPVEPIYGNPFPEMHSKIAVERINLLNFTGEQDGDFRFARALADAARRNPGAAIVLENADLATGQVRDAAQAVLQKRFVRMSFGNREVKIDTRAVGLFVKPSTGKETLVGIPSKSFELQMGGVLQPAASDGRAEPGSGDARPGDKWWGPGGGGEGESGVEPGDEGMDPSEIEVTLEEYFQLLASDLELPNIRRTSSQSERVTWHAADADRKPEGEILWTRMIPAALGYGKLLRKHALEKLTQQITDAKAKVEQADKVGNAEESDRLSSWVKTLETRLDRAQKARTLQQLARRGTKVLTPADYVTVTKEPIREPEFKAVVVFAIDMSGSMGGRPQELAKELVFNITGLLKHFYKGKVVVRFVGFDTEGHEFTEKEVFSRFLGGGTRYSGGIAKGREILDSYPTADWNKYMFTIGDGETGDDDAAESIQHYDELYKQTQYMGFAYLSLHGDWGWSGGYTDKIKAWASDKQWFGFAHMKDDDHETVMAAIKEFLGKKGSTTP